MKSVDREVAHAAHAGAGTTYAEEAPSQHAKAAYEEKQAAEKPRASEEILIEEINIDGMCGVY